ncbi:unnamed protein product [Mytilus coruscus]|uniref:CCHC-type domain-containing protein n=1 Tax=Mytilus coruscus TaxID=42192 RepID=A0A6J8D1C2_MYTCO|nr:unnamed protein product [Mytilus coruscus]
MVKKRAQAPPRIGGDENETETDMLENETKFNLPDDTEPETDEGQPPVLPRAELFPSPSTSGLNMPPPLDSRPRRSQRLLRKKQVFHEPDLSANETDVEPQGDTAGLYGAAFRGNFFQSPPDPHRLSETRAIHARTSNEKGSVRSARSRSKSYAPSDNTSSSEDSCPDSSDDKSLGTSLLNRFEAVARLGKWDDKSKLRELLPHLQGAAGDFVFDQLPQKTLSSYRKITKEMQNRFGVFETKKNYKVLFNRRNRKPGETTETYAAELKRIYDKAYTNRDRKIRQEDLLQRFLMGLSDHKTRVHVELYKDPSTIEEAIHNVITYLETTNSPQEEQSGGKFKKQVRQLKNESKKPDWKTGKLNGKKEQNVTSSVEGLGKTQLEQVQKLFKQMHEENKKEENQNIGSYQRNKPFGPSSNRSNYKDRKPNNFNGPRDSVSGQHPQGDRNFLCFHCGQPGHYARNCFSNPKRPDQKLNSQNWSENGVDSNDQELTHHFQEKGQSLNVVNGDVSHSSGNSEVIEVNKEGSKDELITSQTEKKNYCTYCDDSKEHDLTNPQVVGRQVLRSDGVYVKGQVQGFGINFTVDTGAARTVLSKQAFQQISKSKRPILKSSNMLASADGKPLDELGKAIFNVKLKELDFNIELVVANIEDEALLGLDVLIMQIVVLLILN